MKHKFIGILVFMALAVFGFAGADWLAQPAHAAPPSVGGTCDAGSASGIQNGIDCAKPTGAPTNLLGPGGVFQIVLDAVLFVIGLVAVVMLIIGAVHYVTSGGDSSAVGKAKNTIVYAIVGVVLSFMAFAIVNFVVQQFGRAT